MNSKKIQEILNKLPENERKKVAEQFSRYAEQIVETEKNKRKNSHSFLLKKRANLHKYQAWALLLISIVLVSLLISITLKRLYLSTEHLTSAKALNWAVTENLNNLRPEILEEFPDSVRTDSLKNRLTLLSNSITDLRGENDIIIEKAREIDTPFITYIVSVMLVQIVGFFLAQILLKLYKYNMVVSGFYLAIADAFKVLENKSEVSKIDEIKFNELVNLFIPKNINLDIPDSPKLGDFNFLNP